MPIRMTPEQKANLQEFWNRVDFDAKPRHQWQRYERQQARADILWLLLIAVAVFLGFWAVVGWVIASR